MKQSKSKKGNKSHHSKSKKGKITTRSKFLEAIKKFKLVKDKELGNGLIHLTAGLFLMLNKKK